ncbi:MAG: hypothetical protein KAX09_04740 [Candidatus Heimdallarchaeota archaeon]|nr:hypothetical protein [Candidatus Heimdallarchaeota archaeon]MCK4290272.1 hypothetical protein [Candidatus Heimdallarchaeota archaeon]
MKPPFRDAIIEKLFFLADLATMKKSEITELLNKQMKGIISILSNYLNFSPKIERRNITFGKVKEDLGADFGLNRLNERVVFADWILAMQSKTRIYLLTFLIIKESLLLFFEIEKDGIIEAIINIITILLVVELFKIDTIDNPILSAIRSKIYSEEIAGFSMYYWDNLLLLLIRNNVPFSDVLEEYEKTLKKKLSNSKEIIKQFSDWTFSKTIKEGDSILPFYTNLKLIEIIELLLELGPEKGTTSYIARKLDLSQKTIAKRFKALNESFTTYWRTDINYEKINLHNYLFKITLNKRSITEKLTQDLIKIPYLRSIFLGTDSKIDVLYSPALNCPHIISKQLEYKLNRMKDKGLINDYCLQLVRETYRNFTITNLPYNSSISTFRNFISQDETSLRKFTFYHHKRSSILPVKDKPLNLDQNLLNFLSVLNSKLLLRSRYGVSINEFKKFYMKNDIPITDIDAQTDLLYQNELRARNKGLLSFSLYMRNLMKRIPDVLIFEIPTSNGYSDKDIRLITNKLQIFSQLGQKKLYDRHIFNIPGVAHTHPIKEVIQEYLEEQGLATTFYTVRFHKLNFVPLQDLYDFDERKWRIIDFKE